MTKVVKHRICPICEATCGLTVTFENHTAVDIRGNKDDVFSHGYICPKGAALGELDTDPDRLRTPLVRRDGKLQPASWEEAFAEIERRLPPIVAEHGRESLGVYLGNPSAHKASLGLYLPVFIRALGTRQVYSASTLDQYPKQVALGLMYGETFSQAVPDIDRSNLIIVMGANPMASNGSLWTVPDFRGRVKAMQKRGGKMIVLDPRRTQTAKLADEHLFIKPGTDAYLLAAMAQTLFADGKVKLGALADHLEGVSDIEGAVASYTPEAVEELTGVAATDIRRLAHLLADTDGAALYGRIGTCVVEFGTLTSWLLEVINFLTGNVDVPGGVMWPLAPAFQGNSAGRASGRKVKLGRWTSRVRGMPEVLGELPAVCLAEEMETPGKGQIRALFTVAGNPVLSAPDGDRIASAMEKLDFMVSLDIYLSETSRLADVVLPGTSPWQECQFDISFHQVQVRNAVRFSPTIFPPGDRPQEWEVLARLAQIISGDERTIREADDDRLRQRITQLTGMPGSSIEGRDPEDIFTALSHRTGVERLVDLGVRTGPYGDGFGAKPDGLTLQKLIDTPDGFDFGPLQPRMPDVICTQNGKVTMAPSEIMADFDRLGRRLRRDDDAPLLLVGRRDVRTNNSWLHNLPMLAKGPNRCTLMMHPDDARDRQLKNGQIVEMMGDGRAVAVPLEVTNDIMPGVVSMPHGFGHEMPGTNWQTARNLPGSNSNIVANTTDVDAISGTAVLNGIPVDVRAMRPAAAAE